MSGRGMVMLMLITGMSCWSDEVTASEEGRVVVALNGKEF